MSTTELLVIAVGVFLGYWIVAKLIGGRSAQEPSVQPEAGDGREGARADAPVAVEWHEVLDVDRTASVAQIRAAYESLMAQYHPDKMAHLDADLRTLAQKRTCEIEAAYHAALRERGYE